MGNTVWVLREDQDDDEWDHSLVVVYEKDLDRLAKELDVKKLCEFYDFSVLAEEFGGDEEPNYVCPKFVKASVLPILSALQAGNSPTIDRRDDIIEELEDILTKVNEAEVLESKVRLSVVP